MCEQAHVTDGIMDNVCNTVLLAAYKVIWIFKEFNSFSLVRNAPLAYVTNFYPLSDCIDVLVFSGAVEGRSKDDWLLTRL